MTQPTHDDIARIWCICKRISQGVWIGSPPSLVYADNVARLLFVTAAQEGDCFKARRQYGFDPLSTQGAFSLWQFEKDSLKDSLRTVDMNPAGWHHVIDRVLSPDEANVVKSTNSARLSKILLMVQSKDHDALGCFFARLHYQRDPFAVPNTVVDLGYYWKRAYNTSAGAGHPGDFVNKWVALGLQKFVDADPVC